MLQTRGFLSEGIANNRVVIWRKRKKTKTS